jgi:UPF0042 nucleotide-binding protein
MRLVIVSGLSGSGKSVALHMLEDLDYYCVDNIPAGLLPMFISHTVRSHESTYGYTAVGVDARNRPAEIASVPKLVAELKRSGVACEVLFLRADQEALLKRYSETRRRHPLSRDGLGLADAISQEQALLEPIADAADLIIDTMRISFSMFAACPIRTGSRDSRDSPAATRRWWPTWNAIRRWRKCSTTSSPFSSIGFPSWCEPIAAI